MWSEIPIWDISNCWHPLNGAHVCVLDHLGTSMSTRWRRSTRPLRSASVRHTTPRRAADPAMSTPAPRSAPPHFGFRQGQQGVGTGCVCVCMGGGSGLWFQLSHSSRLPSLSSVSSALPACPRAPDPPGTQSERGTAAYKVEKRACNEFASHRVCVFSVCVFCVYPLSKPFASLRPARA